MWYRQVGLYFLFSFRRPFPHAFVLGEELLVGKRPHSKRTVEHDESTDEAKSARLDLMPALI
jgi:hypothetical protein